MSLISMLTAPVGKAGRSAEPAAADGENALAFADAVDGARAESEAAQTLDDAQQAAVPGASPLGSLSERSETKRVERASASRNETSPEERLRLASLAQPVSSAPSAPLNDPYPTPLPAASLSSGSLTQGSLPEGVLPDGALTGVYAPATAGPEAPSPGAAASAASVPGAAASAASVPEASPLRSLSERSETKRVERAPASRNEAPTEERLRLAPLAQPVSSSPSAPLDDPQTASLPAAFATARHSEAPTEEGLRLAPLAQSVSSAAAAAPPLNAPIQTAAPVAASAPMVRPALLPQISAPVLALTQAADGDHQLTLTISPESLGPVTVRAHITAGSIHIELQAPTDLGRDALRTILADLRRDLAGTAPHATLALSAHDSGGGQQHSGQQHSGQSGNAFTSSQGQASQNQPGSQSQSQNQNQNRGPSGSPAPAHGDPAPTPAPLTTPHGGIDVYA